MAEDYGVSLKITADTSDLEKVPKVVEASKREIEKPVTVAPVKVPVEAPQPVKVQVEAPQPVKVPVEAPQPVKIEAKANKVRVEIDDAEAKKRIEALTEKEGIKRIRVVTEGGELAERKGGKEIFELEVDAERAKKTIADLKADARFKVTADTSDALKSFNAMRAASAALQGNVAALGVEIAKLGTSTGTLKTLGVAGFSAIGAAIAGVVMLAKSLRDLFATVFNVGAVGKDISGIGASLIDIRNKANEFAEAMNDARKASELVNQSLEKEVAALGRVAQAQNEINRQRELAAAKSDDERSAINFKYDRKSIDIGGETAQKTEEVNRKGIVDEIARLEQEIAESKKTQAAYEEKAAAARARANLERPTNAATAAAEDAVSFFTGKATSEEKSNAASGVATQAMNAADDEAERRAELEERLEKARHALKMADLDAEARKAEEAAAQEKNATDQKTKKSQEEEKKAKDNAEKDKRQRDDQADFDRQRSRSAADADFDDRMRASKRISSDKTNSKTIRDAAENDQLEMLRQRKQQADDEVAEAEKILAEEMKKDAADRDEKRMARARDDIRNAEATSRDAQRQGEDLEAQIRARKTNEVESYFGGLAEQIEASRPKNRLTAMGLGSGVSYDNSVQRDQANNVKQLVSLAKRMSSALESIKSSDTTATYAP